MQIPLMPLRPGTEAEDRLRQVRPSLILVAAGCRDLWNRGGAPWYRDRGRGERRRGATGGKRLHALASPRRRQGA